MNLTKALFAVHLLGSVSALSMMAGEPNLTHFERTALDDHRTKIVMSAEGDAKSYFIRVDKRPEGADLPGFFESQGFAIFNGGHSKDKAFLMDNGPLDEDATDGVFAITLNTGDWPEGDYMLRVGASNKPSPEKYKDSARYIAIKVGNPAPAPISNLPKAEHAVVWKNEDFYACFPALYVFPDGRLGTRFSTKATNSHMESLGGSQSLISSDGGTTWEKANEPLVERRWQTKDGRLVEAFAPGYIYVDAAKEEELKKAGKIVEPVRPGVIAYNGGAVKKESVDQGKTWQNSDIPLPEGCLGLNLYQMAASQLVTSSGVRLTAVYGFRGDEKADGHKRKSEVYFLRSEDDGKTWKCQPMYPNGPSDLSRGFDETAIVEAADKTLIALMRTSEEDYLWQAVSKDDGVTWTQPAKTKIAGFPAHIIKLSDGRLLCAYGRRSAPMGVRAVLSRDNGKTWDTDKELVVRNDGVGGRGDVGYPQIYERPDGKIFCIYYLSTDGSYPHIASTIFDLPE